MFFKKKKDPLKTYIKDTLEFGVRKMVKDGIIDLNSPMAGKHIVNYIDHMKKSFAETRPLLQIKYSLTSMEVSLKVLEAVSEFKEEWIKS